MDPFSWIAIIAMIAGAATSFVGAQQSAKAAEQAGKAQNDAAQAAASNEEQQGAEAIRRERINQRRRLARLRADSGTSGVMMDGSSMDVFAETAGAMELQIQDAARSSSMEAQNMRNQGSMNLWEARTQAAATRMSSYGTLISDAGGIAGYGVKSGAFSKPTAKD